MVFDHLDVIDILDDLPYELGIKLQVDLDIEYNKEFSAIKVTMSGTVNDYTEVKSGGFISLARIISYTTPEMVIKDFRILAKQLYLSLQSKVFDEVTEHA